MLTADLPGTGGRIRERVEDFVVDEVPAYLPSGEGDHLFVRIEKRGMTTDAAARALAARARVRPEEVGFAGRKDRHAVTTQWMSLGAAEPSAIEGFEAEGLRVLEVARHGNKLRTGHLRGNRFRLAVRGVVEDAEPRARAVLDRIAAHGLPNRYGPQRFGADGANRERALDWVAGTGRPPRDKRTRKLLVSALQASLFNEVLGRRLASGHFAAPLGGDLCRVEASGGLFVSDDLADVAARMVGRLISATGPIYGARMRWPEGPARALEEEVLAEAGLESSHLDRFRADGRGSRRTLRVFPGEVELRAEGDVLHLGFTLEPGAFATVLVEEVTKGEVGWLEGAGGGRP